jgi:hypothetical protein
VESGGDAIDGRALREQGGQVAAREFPFERLGGRFPVVLKIEQPFGERLQPGEIVGREDLALNDREVDLDLVEPAGVDRSMDEGEAPEFVLQAGDRSCPAMRGTVVDDPEHTACLIVGRPSHDLFDKPVKRSDARGRFAAAEDAGVMDIQGGDVSPGTAAGVLVLDEHGAMRLRGRSGMDAASSLNAGLFVGRDHELVPSQRLAIPGAGVQIENAAGLGGELWVARKDPTAVIPRPNGVLMQPAPDRAAGDGGDQAGLTDLLSDVRRIPMRKRKAVGGGQFTGESLDLHHQFWGEKPGGDPGEDVPPGPPGGLRRNACATY